MPRHLEWRFNGDPRPIFGYSYMADEFRSALKNLDVDTSPPSKNVVINGLPLHTEKFGSKQTTACYTMFETSQAPRAFTEGMKRFDFCITPTAHSKELYEDILPTFQVPLGVNPNHYFPSIHGKVTYGPFKVISAGTNLRKGIPEVCEAFRIANIPNSKLVFKGPERQRRYVPDGVECEFESEELLVDQLRSLFWNCDCYLSGSRGEGWDLLAFQALACGTPTIVPAHTAYLDWGQHAQGWVFGNKSKPAEITIYGECGDWLIPDPEEMAAELKSVYENRQEMNNRALNSAIDIGKNWTWKQSAERVLNLFSDLESDTTGVEVESDLLLEVEAIRDAEKCDVGGKSVGPFSAGEKLRVHWEVARVLETAGMVT